MIITYILKKKRKYIKDFSPKAVYENVKNYNPDFILYFSGSNKTTFQINSWLPVINKLKYKFIILIRERYHYDYFIDKTIPTIFLNTTRLVEEISMIDSIKAALYISNVGKNIHSIRSQYLKHIFIGHGDSDKSSSANNLMKLYDYMFVAGDAHIDRIKKQNLFVPHDYFFKIGRPQIELTIDKKNKTSKKNKLNILYAPTWEGYYEDSCYSSLKDIGKNILNFFNSSTYELIFKPHPLLGTVDSSYLKTTINLSKASHFKSNILYDYFANADILISDISAILSDFLYFNKPIIVYKPKFVEDIHKEYPLTKCAYIIDYNTNLEKLINEIKKNDYLYEKREKMKEYVMGNDDLSDIQKFSLCLSKIL